MNPSESIDVHQWFYSPGHGQLGQVIESQSLWGETTCRVWLPGSDYKRDRAVRAQREW